LIEGTPAATEATLLDFLPYLPEPVVRRWQGESLALEAHGCRTLVLHDVDGLRAEQQEVLHRWLDAGSDGVQIVSTTTVALFSLVAQGLFHEGLYYRLNTTLVRTQG
jgi:transcriptional regulator of aromatic amino acid metabolism